MRRYLRCLHDSYAYCKTEAAERVHIFVLNLNPNGLDLFEVDLNKNNGDTLSESGALSTMRSKKCDEWSDYRIQRVENLDRGDQSARARAQTDISDISVEYRAYPTADTTANPTRDPTRQPSSSPSLNHSRGPSVTPSAAPSDKPSDTPSRCIWI